VSIPRRERPFSRGAYDPHIDRIVASIPESRTSQEAAIRLKLERRLQFRGSDAGPAAPAPLGRLKA
jgi:hypothetical protein